MIQSSQFHTARSWQFELIDRCTQVLLTELYGSASVDGPTRTTHVRIVFCSKTRVNHR